MPTIAVRFIIAAVTAISLTAVPVYPGATLDTSGKNEARTRDPKHPYKIYVTPDSYEKVVAFYKGKGAAQSEAMSIGNSAQQKMAMFSMSDSTIAINWPAVVTDKSGRVTSKTGTRIAIGD